MSFLLIRIATDGPARGTPPKMASMRSPVSSPTEPTRRYTVAGTVQVARPLEGGLYVVATPIGNLNDISLRAMQTLAAAHVVACEDTRVSATLLRHCGIRVPLVPYHEHNAGEMRPKLLARLAAGDVVALISDAGTPLVSDPGFKLVEAAREAQHPVVPVPGPSAILAALVAAGLPTDAFFFDGFLPARDKARRERIEVLSTIPGSLVLFESGPRLGAALEALADGLGNREAAICRELTKLHEEVRRAPLVSLAQALAGEAAPRGEIVIVVAPPLARTTPGEAEVDDQLRRALCASSVKDAAAKVAAATGLPRRDLYTRALSLSKGTR